MKYLYLRVARPASGPMVDFRLIKNKNRERNLKVIEELIQFSKIKSGQFWNARNYMPLFMCHEKMSHNK